MWLFHGEQSTCMRMHVHVHVRICVMAHPVIGTCLHTWGVLGVVSGGPLMVQISELPGSKIVGALGIICDCD